MLKNVKRAPGQRYQSFPHQKDVQVPKLKELLKLCHELSV